ncbi:MAG: BON domain-containing protein [Burkholderiales bacterium]
MALAALSAIAAAQSREEPRNWFGDPFVQLSAAIANCPEPLGPRATEDEMLRQTHHRLERGTRCWLEGRCERQSAYDYDRDIATRIVHAWAAHPEFARSTVWATVQGRIVYLEGCVRAPSLGAKLEAFARGIADVDLAVAFVFRPGTERLPYRTLAAAGSAPR